MFFRKKEKTASFKFKCIFLIIFALAVIGLNLWQFHWTDAVITFEDENIHVLVAKNTYQLKKGMKERQNFSSYEGMLFLYQKYARHGFTREGLLFSVDVIWVNQGKVIDLAANIPPEEEQQHNLPSIFYPRDDSNVLLIVPAGWIAEHRVQIGDRLHVFEQ